MKKLLGISLVWLLLAGSLVPIGGYLAFATVGQNVTHVSTSTTLSSNVAPTIIFGHTVTFTATISPSNATGTVQFNDSSTILGTGTISSGQATFTTSSLSIGSHAIIAKYLGGTNNSPSTGTLTQTVNHAALATTTTTVASSQTPSISGHSVTFTATISPSNATGTMQLLINGANFGSSVALSSGQATFTTSSLPTGTYSLTASYSGDTNFSPSTSNSIPISTTITIGAQGSTPGNVSGEGDDNHDANDDNHDKSDKKNSDNGKGEQETHNSQQNNNHQNEHDHQNNDQKND